MHGHKDKNDCCCCIFGPVAEAVTRWLLNMMRTRIQGTVPGKRTYHFIINEAAKRSYRIMRTTANPVSRLLPTCVYRCRASCHQRRHWLLSVYCPAFQRIERVWCTTQLAKLSFNHSIGRTRSWHFQFFLDRIEYRVLFCYEVQALRTKKLLYARIIYTQ